MQLGGVRHSNRTDRCRVVPQGGRDGCGLPRRVIGRRVCHALRTYNYNPKATKAKPAYPQGCPGGSRGVKAAEAVRRPRSGSVCALNGRARGRAATQCASARRQRKGERSRTVSAQGNWMHSRQSQTVPEEEPDARTDRWLATWPQLGPERPRGAERVSGRASQRALSLKSEQLPAAPRWWLPRRMQRCSHVSWARGAIQRQAQERRASLEVGSLHP